MEPRARRLAIREHLNDARAALDAGDRVRARTAIDAALALDPEYLAAQTLKERIEHEPVTLTSTAGEGRTPSWPPPASPGNDRPSAGSGRRAHGTGAAPPVVSAEGWARFEQRAMARRLERRVAAAREAIQKRQFGAARSALDEIRDIDPHHPDLIALGMELDAGEHSRRARAFRWQAALVAAGILGGVFVGARYLELRVGMPLFLAASNTQAPTLTPSPENHPEQTNASPSAADAPSELPPSGLLPSAPQIPAEAGNFGPPVIARTQPDVVASPDRNRGAETVAELPARPTAPPQGRAPEALVRGLSDALPAVPPAGAATAGRIDARAVPAPIIPTGPTLTPAVSAAVLPGALPADRPGQPAPNPRPASGLDATPSLAATPAAVVAVPRDEDLVRRTLQQYRAAYDNLDARSAQAIWPRVDEDALQRAFAGLQSQHLTFDDCQVQVRGVMGSATCRGTMLYVPKVGNREPRREPRVWTFDLRKVGEDWQIDTARIDR